jgi:2-polyprenyl-3-methyl-5-hydroxy-6-metoxy-1,4-benzoquinol methylase
MKHYLLLLKRKIKHLFGYKLGYSPNNKQTYFSIPELGIKGRRDGTDIQTRMQGLDVALPMLDITSSTFILDAGCAEGLVSRELHNAGVRHIHGFDLQNISIEVAKRVFTDKEGEFFFGQANLLDWQSFKNKYVNILQPDYDIVLYLSIYGHMKHTDEHQANQALIELARLSKNYFVVRSTVPVPEHLILDQGFKVHFMHPAPDANKLTIYKRVT